MSVLVCLPAAAAQDVRGALGRALAPFEMFANPEWRSLWDSWNVGGGCDGTGFVLRPGHEGSPRLVHDVRTDGTPLPSVPGTCSGGPRGMLDLDGFRALSAERAAVRAGAGGQWDLWHALAPEHPPMLPFHTFGERFRRDPQGYPLDRALADFRAQPLLSAFAGHPLAQVPGGRTVEWAGDDAMLTQWFDGPRAAYARQMLDGVRQPDVLTLDGWWIEDGLHPVHASCEDEESCPHTAEGRQYQHDLGAYLYGLPDDVLLVKVRGHC
ncbi:hypothetical protein ACIA8O_25980 [Kitasatospora sp. NPDC051853]|uniref:hypothetical protein n=1 Tax=Kitasatospora sp. NPDC051853 TaxID=3364058 RepID=UPI00379F9A3B